MITPIVIITAGILLFNPTADEVQVVDKTNIRNDQVITSIKKEEIVIREADQTMELKQPVQKKPLSLRKNPGIPGSPARAIEKDTVFNGIILDLSKEELTRLGFMFDEEGYYYLNKLPDGTLLNLWSRKHGNVESKGFEAGIYANKDNKQSMTALDFYPVFLTNPLGKDRHMMHAVTDLMPDQFDLMNDTLVPILFKAGSFTGMPLSDLLLWFKTSNAFFDLIGTEKGASTKRRIDLVKGIQSASTVIKDRVFYGFPEESDETKPEVIPVSSLKLKPEIFSCMGFLVNSKAVAYRFVSDGKFLTTWIWEPGLGASQIWDVDSSKYQKDKVLLYFLTQNSSNRGCSTSTVLGNRDNMLEEFEFCVPVQLDDSTCPEAVRSSIFWIYPNELFFKCLPPDIAGPLLMEFNYQKKRLDPDFVPLMGGRVGITGNAQLKDTVGSLAGTGTAGENLKEDFKQEKEGIVPCVYFTNLCESLPGLDYVTLYPNPATDKLNVDLVLQKAKKIQFRVFDLNGRMISNKGSPENYPDGGQFKYQLDISKLQSGLYLLVMSDEEGAKLTRRFVKN